jgi:hypothetical protein
MDYFSALEEYFKNLVIDFLLVPLAKSFLTSSKREKYVGPSPISISHFNRRK